MPASLIRSEDWFTLLNGRRISRSERRSRLAAPALVILALLVWRPAAFANLRPIQTGDSYRVSTKSTLSGWRLMVDPKTKDEKRMSLKGEGRVVFRERLLDSHQGTPKRLYRVYDQAQFQRVVDKSEQEAQLRKDVRRMVLVEQEQRFVPFSPDGPLQWAEVELVAQHPVIPLLELFLPATLGQPGQTWDASKRAILELTGQHTVSKGGLKCEYHGVIDHQGKQLHQISINGTVTGTVGPQTVRNQIRGAVYVDAAEGRTASFRAMGSQEILGPNDKVLGKDDVDYQILVRLVNDDADLSNDVVAKLPAEPTEENTELVFENSMLGVRFFHPRRWGLVPILEEDILLQSSQSTLALHLEEEGKTPTIKDYYETVRKQLDDAKIKAATVVEPEEKSSEHGRIGRFRLRSEAQGVSTLWEYWLVERGERGVTLYSRISEMDWPKLKWDPERIITRVHFFTPQNPPAKSAEPSP